jgi:hypothetical protein
MITLSAVGVHVDNTVVIFNDISQRIKWRRNLLKTSLSWVVTFYYNSGRREIIYPSRLL